MLVLSASTFPFVVSTTSTLYSFALNVTVTVTFDPGIVKLLFSTVIVSLFASTTFISSTSKPSFGVAFISISSLIFAFSATSTVPFSVPETVIVYSIASNVAVTVTSDEGIMNSPFVAVIGLPFSSATFISTSL